MIRIGLKENEREKLDIVSKYKNFKIFCCENEINGLLVGKGNRLRNFSKDEFRCWSVGRCDVCDLW